MKLGESLRRLVVALLVALTAMTVLAPTVSAQYGGVSGLFVTTSPDRPGFADFSGLGCSAGSEVTLYVPGQTPLSSDPASSQSVPGRVLAVTRAASSADALLNGTFSFPNVRLPDLEPGVYEIHARCGSLDLRVLVELTANGTVILDPDPTAPIRNEIPSTGNGPGSASGPPPGSLPLTGRNADRVVSLGAGFLAVGAALLAASRRHGVARPRAMQET